MPLVTNDQGLVLGEDGKARPPWASVDPLLQKYYDEEWGMPIYDEHGMYERVVLEGFQVGLSWATILRKRESFRAAFDHFEVDTVANYGEDKIEELLENADIIRNRAKITAAITNAQATQNLRDEGGLSELIWSFKPKETPKPRTVDEIESVSDESIAMTKALKKKGFTFVGPVSMYALMEAVGMIDNHVMGSYRRGSSGIWPE